MNADTMIKRIEPTSALYTTALVYSIVVCICYVLPMFKYSIAYYQKALILLLAYLFGIRGWKIDTCYLLPVILSSIGLGIMGILVMWQGDMVEGLNEIIRHLRFFAPAVIFLYTHQYRKRNMVWFVAAFAMISAFICSRTLAEVSNNPMLARILAGGKLSEEYAAYRYQNVGGFEFSYAMGFVSLFFLYLSLEEKSKLPLRIVGGVMFGLLVFFFIKIQYVTLILVVAGASLVMVYQKSEQELWKVLIITLILLTILNLPMIFMVLETYFSTGDSSSNAAMLILKFGQLSEFFSGAGISVLGTRARVYWEAIERFLNSPIWGNVTMKNGYFLEGMTENHSTLLGYLQGMGVIGTFMFYYPVLLTKKAIRHVLSSCSAFAVKAWSVIIDSFLVLSVLNPVQYCFEICFALYLFIPCAFLLTKEWYR